MADRDFHTFEDLPGINDPAVAEAARERILARHSLAALRQASGKTLSELAAIRGVTKAAIHQLENRPLQNVSVGSLVGYFQALGHQVDEAWVAQTLTKALPPASS